MTALRSSGTQRSPFRAIVLGDLALDVVLAPARPLEHGTDVPGVVRLHQGGSAANTARWLARLGVRSTLVCAVGRDGPGRALVAALERAGVTVRAARPGGARTARIGMVVDAAGERSFVADRGAADLLAPGDLRPAWFRGAGVLHLPGYSLLGSPLGEAAARAVILAREAGAGVTVDLASAAPLLARGRPAAHALVGGIAPDLLFTNAAEAAAFLGDADLEGLLDFAPVAVVKRGAGGATLVSRPGSGPIVRLEVATDAIVTADTTGAGDAFDAGFLAAWLAADRATTPAVLRRAIVAGHRVAARQLRTPRAEPSLR
jgi:sugar/nucleoside kinase (ribokinase family)